MRILNPKDLSASLNNAPDSEPKKGQGLGAASSRLLSAPDFIQDWDDVKAQIEAKASPTELSQKPQDSRKKEYHRVLAKAVHLLSMREHSVKEIKDKLAKKCDNLEIVQAVVDELIEKKYLSNSRFAESYVRSRRSKGFGPTKIRIELTSKGIDSGMADDYLNANSSIWFEIAEAQRDKKYRDEAIRDYNTWSKRARFLQSRGFTMDHIHSVLRRPEAE